MFYTDLFIVNCTIKTLRNWYNVVCLAQFRNLSLGKPQLRKPELSNKTVLTKILIRGLCLQKTDRL